MSKPKVKPTEFPVNIDGKIQWVKKGDYAKAVSSQLGIKLKTDVRKTHIEQIIDAIEAGKKEMGPDTPPEFVTVFDTVAKDYEAAQDEVIRKEQEEADKKAKEEEEKKEKEAAELALFESVKDTTLSFADLSDSFDTGENNNQFIAKDGTTDEQLFAAFNASLNMGEFTSWMKGDLVVEIENRGHVNVISRIAEQRGIPFPSLYRMARTARAFPPSERQAGVGFTTYSEIANAKFSDKPEEQAKAVKELADKAISEGKTKALEVRDLVKQKQGKPTGPAPEKLPEEDEKRVFLVIDPEAESPNEVVTAVGFPKELFEGGAMVVDLKTGKKFAENGFRKSAENRWVELPTYTKPEPPKEEKTQAAAAPAKAAKAAPAAPAAPAKGAKGSKKK